jgi:3-isopropylmalate dehydrogenase
MRARIVLLPGDGVGPEVTSAAQAALAAVADSFGHQFTFETHLIGGAALRRDLPPLPDDTIKACESADAILLGAVGAPEFDSRPPGQRPESALLQIRRRLGLYANLRPARVWPGLEGAGPLKPEVLGRTDMLVVRELTGGLYYGEPRGISPKGDEAWNTMRYSRAEIDRIARVAFTAARARQRHVTSVDKMNVLETSRLWRSVVTEVAADYPDVRLDHMLVDSCAMRITLAPASFDVIVTENLFGDILSDEAGAVVGSLGLLPSASLGEGPGLFEPVHGSAPDIAGRDVANPIGAVLSAAMLLRHALKLEEEAAAVETAVAAVTAGGELTRDLGGPASCSGLARAIVTEVARCHQSG